MSKKPARSKPRALSKPGKTVSPRKTNSGRPTPQVNETGLLEDLRSLILSARQRIAVVANSTTTLLYWHLGQRLLKENLQNQRAAYGKQILATVSRELTAEFGRGFSYAAVNRALF